MKRLPRASSGRVEPTELAHCVASAKGSVRAVGAGHSFAPLVAGTGTIIDVSGLEGPDVIAAGAGTARLRAGASLRSLSKSLDAVGMAFRNLGDIDVQTLAGAIATGTHGTGSTLRCLSAEMTGGTTMTASGEIVEIRPEDVPGACVSLGLLGILLEIEMRVVPAHSLRRRVSVAPVSTVLAEMHERWAAHRQFEFFCVPQTGKAIQATHDSTDAPHGKPPLDLDNAALRALRIARDLGRRAPWLRRALVQALMSLQGEEDFVGSSWKVLTKPRKVRFVEMEYHLPPEAAGDAIAELLLMIEGQHPEIYFPVEVRQTAGDDGWLSPFQGGNRISVAVHADASEDSRRIPSRCRNDLSSCGRTSALGQTALPEASGGCIALSRSRLVRRPKGPPRSRRKIHDGGDGPIVDPLCGQTGSLTRFLFRLQSFPSGAVENGKAIKRDQGRGA